MLATTLTPLFLVIFGLAFVVILLKAFRGNDAPNRPPSRRQDTFPPVSTYTDGGDSTNHMGAFAPGFTGDATSIHTPSAPADSGWTTSDTGSSFSYDSSSSSYESSSGNDYSSASDYSSSSDFSSSSSDSSSGGGDFSGGGSGGSWSE